MPQERPRTLIDELIGLYRSDPHFAKVLAFVAMVLAAIFIGIPTVQFIQSLPVFHDIAKAALGIVIAAVAIRALILCTNWHSGRKRS